MTPRAQRLVEQWDLLEEILGDLDRDGQGSELTEERGREIFEKALEETNRRTARKEAAPPASKIVSLPERRGKLGSRAVLYAGVTVGALAAAAAAVATIAPLRRQVEAWIHPVEAPRQQLPVPVPSGPPKPSKEMLAATAHAHREAAFRDVQEGYFHDASDELDIAELMDPHGEDDPRVQQARHDILYGAPRLMRDAKTGLEYWEIPHYKPRPVQR